MDAFGISRELLDQRVVLFRTKDSTIVALDDRCAHRQAPCLEVEPSAIRLPVLIMGFGTMHRGDARMYPLRCACHLLSEFDHFRCASTVRLRGSGWESLRKRIGPSSLRFRWWAYIQNYGHKAARAFQAGWESILKQDKEILEAIELTRKNATCEQRPEILVAADGALAKLRRIQQKVLEAEHGISSSAGAT